MARGKDRFAAVTGAMFAAASVLPAVYAALLLVRGWGSYDAPFWIFAFYAGIALLIAVALWAFAASLLSQALGKDKDGNA